MFTKSGRIKRCTLAALAVAGIALVQIQPGTAQTRTIASLGDVPTLVPAPYHPQTATAHYSSALYDSHPYYGGIYLGVGPHYWH
jgi:hypothetical protein